MALRSLEREMSVYLLPSEILCAMEYLASVAEPVNIRQMTPPKKIITTDCSDSEPPSPPTHHNNNPLTFSIPK